MLIHSFSDSKGGLEDFAAFLRALKFEDAAIGKLAGPVLCDGVSLYAGWVQDKAPRGTSPTAYLDELRDYAAKLSQWCDRVRASCEKKYSTP